MYYEITIRPPFINTYKIYCTTSYDNKLLDYYCKDTADYFIDCKPDEISIEDWYKFTKVETIMIFEGDN